MNGYQAKDKQAKKAASADRFLSRPAYTKTYTIIPARGNPYKGRQAGSRFHRVFSLGPFDLVSPCFAKDVLGCQQFIANYKNC